jgi:dihydroorotase
MTAKPELVIRGGRIVHPDSTVDADLAIEDGKIVGIGAPGSLAQGRREIDATGRHVLPGAIDVHVHLRDPGFTYKEDWATGTAAAAIGGVTTVFDMPNTDPATDSVEALEVKRDIARRKSHVNFGLYGVLYEKSLPHLEAMYESGAIGFKCFMAETTGEFPTPHDGLILEGFETIARLGARCTVHAENGPIVTYRRERMQAAGRTDAYAHLASRPEICEMEAVGRAILFAEWTGMRLHIAHKSSKDALFLVRDARGRGVDVTVETCPQYLLLTSEDVAKFKGVIRANPPVREPGHADGLWQGLRDGTIDMIATDHAPHTWEEKTYENIWSCARGIVGLETQMPLMLTEVSRKRMSINEYVRWSSFNPAQKWDLYPQKGALQVGSDADITIVDLQHKGIIEQGQLHSLHKFSPWHGRLIQGKPIHTIVEGRVVVLNGELVGEPGWGSEVQQNRQPGAPKNVNKSTRVTVNERPLIA